MKLEQVECYQCKHIICKNKWQKHLRSCIPSTSDRIRGMSWDQRKQRYSVRFRSKKWDPISKSFNPSTIIRKQFYVSVYKTKELAGEAAKQYILENLTIE